MKIIKILTQFKRKAILVLVIAVALCSFSFILNHYLSNPVPASSVQETPTTPVYNNTPTPAENPTPNPAETANEPQPDKVTPTATPDLTPVATTIPQVRFITVTDEEVRKAFPLVPNAAPHFLPDNKVVVYYKGTLIPWKVTIGVDEGKLYFKGIPLMIDMSAIDPNAPAYLERRQDPDNRFITREWVVAIPPWLDFKKYDPEISELPTFVSVQTDEGWATIGYLH